MATIPPNQPPPVYMPPPIHGGAQGGYPSGYSTEANYSSAYTNTPTSGAYNQSQPPPSYPVGHQDGIINPIEGVQSGRIAEEGVGKSELGFDDKSIRRGFMRKVFFIIFVQLLVVISLIAIFLFVDPARKFVQTHVWMYYVSYACFLVSYITIACCTSVARKIPGNFIFLGILTLSLGYMTAMISSFYETNIVILALGISAASCFAVILFSLQTKYDFTKYIGVLFVLGFVLFFFGLFAIIFCVAFKIKFLYLVYAALGALLFMAYLAVDIQMLMGSKKYSIDPEDYIYAAVQIFVDLVYIFIFILSLIGGGSSR